MIKNDRKGAYEAPVADIFDVQFESNILYSITAGSGNAKAGDDLYIDDDEIEF
jgi:hypothetical protein